MFEYYLPLIIYFGKLVMYFYIFAVLMGLVVKIMHMAGVIFTVNPEHLNAEGKVEYGFKDKLSEEEKRSLKNG